MSLFMQTTTPMEVPCRSCNGLGDDAHLYAGGAPDPDFCPDCGGVGTEFVDLATLGHNLAVAGALCKAFELGDEHGYRVGVAIVTLDSPSPAPWRPNTAGRPAP